MLLALVLAAVVSAGGPAASGPRMAVLPRTDESLPVLPAVEARLVLQHVQLVPWADVAQALKGELEAGAGFAEAQAKRQRGLEAEQNLDLDAALSGLSAARDQLVDLGAAWLDPLGLAEARLEVARCLFERNDPAAALDELRRWAEADPQPLQAQAFAPAFVTLSLQARAEAPVRRPQAPLQALWATGLLDGVVVVAPVGLQGAEADSLVLYRKGTQKPARMTFASRLGTPEERGAAFDRAVHDLVGAAPRAEAQPQPQPRLLPFPVPATEVHFPAGPSLASAEPKPEPKPEPRPEAPAATPTAAAPADRWPLWLRAGLLFPQVALYSRYGADTTDIGLALGARVELEGWQVGGRLDLATGHFGWAEVAATARWELQKGSWAFGVEPGMGFALRTGFTRPTSFEGEALGPEPTALLLLVEAGGSIGYHFNASWCLEEQVRVGGVTAADYDLNAMLSFETSLAYRF
jgi:tetratricopeptide (TPR) repeat protein